MLIVCSPTKTMKKASKFASSLPLFQKESEVILKEIRKYHVADLQKLYKCNEKIAMLNYERFLNFNYECKSNALLSYNGLQFKRMDTKNWEEADFHYAQDHLRILSAFYGMLRPLDAVDEYRLDLENQFTINHQNLTDYWKDKIISEMKDEMIVDCCSKEYSDLLTMDKLKIEFRVQKQGKLKNEATASKCARGLFIRYVVLNRIDSLDGLKLFNCDGYRYDENLSDNHHLYFIKEEKL